MPRPATACQWLRHCYRRCSWTPFSLAYDDERSGDFKPLRYLSKDKVVVLGMATTRFDKTESEGTLKRRIEEAVNYAPLDHLVLGPAPLRDMLRLAFTAAQEAWA